MLSKYFFDFVRRIADYRYLKKYGAVTHGLTTLERRHNISIGRHIVIDKHVRLRSRCDKAKIFIGNRSKIRESVEINAKGDKIWIDENCFIAKNCWIGGFGRIKMGSNSMIGIGSIIVSSDHDFINIMTPYYDHSEISKPITIGANSWIGAGAVILGGTEIGAGSVVAAGSVIKGRFPENALITGIPGELKQIIKRP